MPNTPRVIIDVKGISKFYRRGQEQVTALRDIDLKIHQRESVAIMGSSGSGKSTLLHILGCLDIPCSGTYLFHQQDVSQLTETELSQLRASSIGFIFQSYNLIPQLNVYENVELPFNYRTDSACDVHDRILDAIEQVGLKHRLRHTPNQLSGGEMQRVAIARAIAISPLLILADEPTGNLDSKNAQSIMHLFQTLNKNGVTLILITHDEEIGNYCQRKVRISDGRIL